MTGLKPLLEIMARLRDPEGGCPWDLEQDFSSISPHTIEEAYEVDEAIASGDLESLRDELGDLLFQVVFQARIAEEMGAFDFEGVTEAITSKLVRRHPHIFADAATPKSVRDQAESWETIKAAERAAVDLARRSDPAGSGHGPPNPFAGIPRSLPALARSAKLAGRLARMDSGQVDALSPTAVDAAASSKTSKSDISRLTETLSALRNKLGTTSANATDRDAARRLVGQGLRAWVLLARELDVDPEQALRLLDDEMIASVRG